ARGGPTSDAARQAVALVAEHDPHLAQSHLSQEGLIAIPPRSALRGAPQVGFDDLDASIRPAEPVGMVPHGVLQLVALGVGEHLVPRRLTNVDHRFALTLTPAGTFSQIRGEAVY